MSVLIKIAERNGAVFAAAPCGCVHRMNVSSEQIGERVISLIQHARDVAAGETGGCYIPSQIQMVAIGDHADAQHGGLAENQDLLDLGPSLQLWPPIEPRRYS